MSISLAVCVVIVTYGSRQRYVKKVIAELRHPAICRIIIVCNGVTPEARAELTTLAAGDQRVKCEDLKVNTGSAAGFSSGMELARNNAACELIWLLDDDNVPQEGALEALLKVWAERMSLRSLPATLVLASFRRDKDLYRRISAGETPSAWTGRRNYFLGFHVLDLGRKVRKWIFSRDPTRRTDSDQMLPLPYALYGGLFFHKRLLDSVGYPDTRYFLYADDHEFTYRMVKRGCALYLVPGSVIKDEEPSWFASKTPGPSLLKGSDQDRLFLTVRNRVLFENEHFRFGDLVYKVNKLMYLSYLKLAALLLRRGDRYRIIQKAVQAGEGLALPRDKAR